VRPALGKQNKSKIQNRGPLPDGPAVFLLDKGRGVFALRPLLLWESADKDETFIFGI
jgi:hypothetical protein